MSKLISLSLNLSKVPKEALYEGKKGKYLSVDVWIDDTPDQYENDASCSIRQSQEDRQAKKPKTYIGNGKKIFGWDDAPAAAPTGGSTPAVDDSDDIPFAPHQELV